MLYIYMAEKESSIINSEERVEEEKGVDDGGKVERAGEKEYVIFENPEKKDRRRLGPWVYMPYSTSRILLSGLPGVGKRNLILNMIHKMDPYPSCIHVVHIDPLTSEYDALGELGIPVLIYSPEDFPTAGNIEEPEEESGEGEESGESEGSEGEEKKKVGSPLVIVDEITTDQLGRVGAARFERLANYVCTHRDTTLICSIQSMMSIPAKVRRAFNHFALWRQNDGILNKMIAGRCGVGMDFLEDLFSLCKNKHEFIYIDLDEGPDSVNRYRLNWMYPIVVSEGVSE